MKKLFFVIGLLGLTFRVAAQLSGTISVPGAFPTFSACINYLNSYGVTGPLHVNLTGGASPPTSGINIYQIPGTSSVNTITFKGTGNGFSVVATPGARFPTAAVQDGLINLIGTDWVTFDNFYLIEYPNLNSPFVNWLEYGFGFFKANNFNGCQHNTIKNCTFTLDRHYGSPGTGIVTGGNRCIQMLNSSVSNQTMALTSDPLGPEAGHSYNRIYSNLFTMCATAIHMHGFVSNVVSKNEMCDIENDIGGTSAATGNTITNYGSGSNTSRAAAIWANHQYDLNVGYNQITNTTFASASTVQGGTLMAISSQIQRTNISIHHNTLTIKSGSLTPRTEYIQTTGTANNYSSTTTSVNISNNVFSSCSHTYGTAMPITAIMNSAPAGSVIIQNNTFTNCAFNQHTVAPIIDNQVAIKSVNISSNIMTFSMTSGFTPLVYAIRTAGGDEGTEVNISNNVFEKLFATMNSTNEIIRVEGTNRNLTCSQNLWSNCTIGAEPAFLIRNVSTTGSLVAINSNSMVGMTVSSKGIVGYSGSGGATVSTSVQISGNRFSNMTGLGGFGFSGIISAEGSALSMPYKRIYDNTISNISCAQSGSTTLAFFGISANYLGSPGAGIVSAIYNNTVQNISMGAAFTGIQVGDDSSPNFPPAVYSNTVAQINSSSYADLYGIQVRNTRGAVNIYKNKVGGLYFNQLTGSTVGRVAGIECTAAGDARIYNNLIGDFSVTSVFTNSNVVSGINISGTGSYKIYYNSISSTLSGYPGCVNATTTAQLDMRNNLLVSNGFHVYRRTAANTASYNAGSDNNLYSSPTNSLFAVGFTTYTGLAGLKANLGGRDMNSVTDVVPFLSTSAASASFLSVSTSSATMIEQGAQPIAWITDDFYGNPRDPSAPDIGAIEGNYLPGADKQGPLITSIAVSAGRCNTSGATFSVNISDVSGVGTGTAMPVLYYSVNNGTYASTAGTLSSGTSTNGIWTFSAPYSGAVNSLISYFVVAQDQATLTNISSSHPTGFVATSVINVTGYPVSPGTHTIGYTLAGSYSVGAGGTFTTLTQAAEAYNNSCLTGSVTYVLVNANYSAGEVFPITFRNNEGASATNSLLITPDAGTSVEIRPSVTSNTLPSTLKFLDSRYISIDGNNGGSTLSIVNNNFSTHFSSAIWLASGTTSTSGNSHIGLLNTAFSGTTTPGVGTGVIASRDGTMATTSGGIGNDHIRLEGNSFVQLFSGIRCYGTSSGSFSSTSSWHVVNNLLGPTGTSTLYLRETGIEMYGADQVTVSGNTVTNIRNGTNVSGITIGFACSDFTVNGNQINTLRGGAVTGINIDTGIEFTNGHVTNNVVCDVFATGIILHCLSVAENHGTGGIVIKHNSLGLTTGTLSGNSLAVFATFYIGHSAKTLTVVNNIFHTGMITTNPYHFLLATDASPAVLVNFDHNLYSVGTTTNGKYALLGTSSLLFTNSHISTFPQFVSTFGQNANSKWYVPAFTSSVDLHLSDVPANALIDNLGTPSQSAQSDIDGQLRSTLTPDFGADEFTASSTCTTAIGGTVIPSGYTVCANPTASVALNSINSGGGLGSTFQWEVSNSPTGPFSVYTAGSGTDTPFLSAILTPTNYYFRLTNVCPSASVTAHSNTVNVLVRNTPVLTLSTSHSMVCGAQSVTLTGNAINAQWYVHYDQFSISSNTVAYVFTPTISGVYFYTSNQACSNTISPFVSVVVSSMPSVTLTAQSTNSICAGTSNVLTATTSVPGFHYLWNTGATTHTVLVTPTISTTYSLMAYHPGGCSVTVTRSVGVLPAPNLSVTGAATICAGQTTTLAASGASSYFWNTNSNAAVITVTPSATTNYTVTGYSSSGCTKSLTVQVAIIPPVTVAISAPSLVCAGQSVTLTANGASGYTWNTSAPGSTLAAIINSTTTFSVTGKTGLCSGVASFTVNASPAPVLSVTGATAACFGDLFNFSASGANSYTWMNNAASPAYSAVATANTIYTVSGTNSLGCTSDKTISVTVYTIPIISVVQTATTVCNGSSLSFTASGASTYTWSGGPSTAIYSLIPTATAIYTVNATSAHGCNNTATAQAAVVALPQFSVSPMSQTVCAGAVVTFTANGAPNYSWSNGDSGPVMTATSNSSAIYTVTATNTNNCMKTETVNVTVNALPQLTVSGTSVICAGESTTLTASGAASYTWQNVTVSNSLVLAPNVTTVVILTGISSQGCPGFTSSSITVNQNPTISVSPSSQSVCLNSLATFSASGASTYSWNNSLPNSVLTVTALTPGTYIVTGISTAGCTGTAIAQLAIYSLPQLTFSAISQTICLGETVTFSASGAPSYSWSNGGTGPVITTTPVTATVYSVTAISINNCVSTATVDVIVNPLPVVSISGPSDICSGQAATFTASGASSYTWQNTSFSNTVILSPNVTSAVTLTGSSSFGCLGFASVTITVHSNPTVTVLPFTQTVCVNSLASFTANGAPNYLWSTGAASNVLVVTATGSESFTLAGISAEGCISTKIVSLFTKPVPTITIVPPIFTACAGTATNLVASGASNYLWTGGGPGNSFNFTVGTNTIISVTGTGVNGCAGSASASIMALPLPVILLSPNAATICNGQEISVTASGASTYIWNEGTNGPVLTASPTVKTSYTVAGTSDDNCPNTAVLVVNIDDCLGVREVQSNDVMLYPNPTSGLVWMSFTNEGIRGVVVMNDIGEQIAMSQTSALLHSLDLGHFAKGLYFVVVKDETYTRVFRVIID
jgi:hypothetical protein